MSSLPGLTQQQEGVLFLQMQLAAQAEQVLEKLKQTKCKIKVILYFHFFAVNIVCNFKIYVFTRILQEDKEELLLNIQELW